MLTLFAKKLDKGQRHALRGAGGVEQLPHHDAKADDDADAAQRSAKTADNGGGYIRGLHAADQADDGGGDDEAQKRMNLGFED